jgi:predicted  nucleic acid-binding Zn-ribbon protein
MVKKGLLGAALGAGTLFLVFGTSAPSYIKTAFCKMRQSAKDAIDPQFEIERARTEIASLQPAFDQNKEVLARAEVAAEHLEREIGVIQANLEQEKATIMALRDKIKTGDFRLTGHGTDAAEGLKAQALSRWDHYNYSTGILKEKQEVLKAKRQTIEAAHRKLEDLRQQKSLLQGRLANVEAKLQMIEARQGGNDFNFDDSALSQAKRTVSELEERLEVMARRVEIDGRYGDLDGKTSTSLVDPRRDVVKEVDEAFGPTTAAKPGGKSL